MASMLPARVYGLRVPAGDMPVPAAIDFPATLRITMAAIDPSAQPQIDETHKVPRATLKLIRLPDGADEDEDDEDEDDDDDDIEAIKARLAGVISDEDEEMSDDDDEDSEIEKNGGPSDPAKAKKAKMAAMTKKLQESLDEELALGNGVNGVNGTKAKGKAKALDIDMSDEDEDEDEDGVSLSSDDEPEEFVICTLDPEKTYQQPLDITIGEHEAVYFQVSGTHDIYLTGNYVIPPDDDDHDHDYDDEELDYDLSPDEDELNGDLDSEEDELDGMQDPRIMEVDSDDEEVPKLIASANKKGKNKRSAPSDDEATTLDDLISKAIKPEAPATNGEPKLSKKQAKKLKNNEGQAVAAAQEPLKKEQQDAPSSDKKKVQFAKNLEQGPTGSPKVEETSKEGPKQETAKLGSRNIQGVTVEDKKLGKGRAAKKGDKIDMRYIGKLAKGGKQFDSNKKGKPFSFKLGFGEVIKGWDIGVVGMTAGGERRLTIPAKLGYGSRGAPPDIPPNSDLIFDIKCLTVG